METGICFSCASICAWDRVVCDTCREMDVKMSTYFDFDVQLSNLRARAHEAGVKVLDVREENGDGTISLLAERGVRFKSNQEHRAFASYRLIDKKARSQAINIMSACFDGGLQKCSYDCACYETSEVDE